jgi:hypothetical protein
MSRTKWVYFKRIPDLSRKHYIDLYKAIVQLEFDHNATEGFTNIERTERLISAILLVKRQTSFTGFADDRLCEQIVTYYQKIPFVVDSCYSTIEVFGGNRKANKAASIIGKLLRFQYSIEDLRFSQQKILDILTDEGYRLSIMRMSIENYHPTQGVSGRFIPKITNVPEGLALLREYRNNVMDAIYEVQSPKQVDFTLRVRKTGGLAVKGEREEIDSVLEEIKQLILGEEGNYA